MLVFQTYPMRVELSLFFFFLQWICPDAGHMRENALYSALNRNLRKAKVIKLDKWDNHLFSWWLLFRKVHSLITSVALFYVCVKVKKSFLLEAILLHKYWFLYLVFWFIFQYSNPPQAWFPIELNSFNFENVFCSKFLSFQWSLVLKVSWLFKLLCIVSCDHTHQIFFLGAVLIYINYFYLNKRVICASFFFCLNSHYRQ